MQRLWAPWRHEYVTGLSAEAPAPEGCFFCAARDGEDDRQHLVLHRGRKAFVMMNRFPYNTGHLMVVCNAHLGEMEALDSETAQEVWSLLVRSKQVLGRQMRADGFNVGINQGRCAGAGIVDHLHVHIVPRWEGDANFMPVVGETKVLSQSLASLFQQLRPAFAPLEQA